MYPDITKELIANINFIFSIPIIQESDTWVNFMLAGLEACPSTFLRENEQIESISRDYEHLFVFLSVEAENNGRDMARNE